MRAKLAALTIATMLLGTAAASAQMAAAPAMKTFAAAGDIAALIAKAKSAVKPGVPTVTEPILILAPYQVNLEYRVAVGPAAIHQKDAELIYVMDGRGTFVIGGKLIGEKPLNATNLMGTGIEGGTPRTIIKGDFIFVPENTAHQFTSTGGGALILMTLHIPHPVPAP